MSVSVSVRVRERERERERARPTKSALPTAPATKSALQDPQSAPATQFALQGPQSAAPPRNLHFEVHKSTACATKSALPGPQTKYCTCHEIFNRSTSPATKLHFKDKVLRLPQFLLKTTHMSKSQDSLHLSRNWSASKITIMSKALRLPRSLQFKVKPLRSLAPVTKSRLWTFLCACHEK